MPLSDEEPLRLLAEILQLLRSIAAKPDPPARPWVELKRSAVFWEELLPHIVGSELSDKECEVCASRVVGYSDSAIADELIMSVSTVKQHTQCILKKSCKYRSALK